MPTTLRDKLDARSTPKPPPPEPPTDAEMLAVGLDLSRQASDVCNSSASSQHNTNHSWNAQHYQGYLNAVKNAETNGGNPPPMIERPSLDGNYDPEKPYFRLEDIDALRHFCAQEPQRQVPYPPDNWNWSKVF